MKKRLTISAFAFCLALMILPARAWAAAGGGSGLTWSYNQGSNTVTVSGTGTITRQDVDAFWDSQSISSGAALIISEGITAIGDEAFGDRGYEIASVTIPSTVESIGEWAFCRCDGLSSVTISGDGVNIGDYAFCDCWGLTSLAFDGDVGSIGKAAFDGCGRLASLTFSGNVGSIGEWAFRSSGELTSLTFPGSVDSIGDGAFDGCGRLTSLTFDGDVGSIGKEAFRYCSQLTSLAFDGSVDSIGDGAFDSCRHLTSLAFDGDVGSLGNSAFADCDSLTGITFNGSLGSIGNEAFSWCRSLTNLVLPEGVTSIGKEAFDFCDSLIRVYLPSTIQTIGNDPFSGCDKLRDVYFGGTAAEWDALGGSKIFGYLPDPVPICHPDVPSSGFSFPDTEAGDLDTLKQLISDGVGVGRTDIELTADLTGLTEKLVIPKDCNVVLDLKGHRITSSASPAIEMLGNLTVLDSTVTTDPSVTNNTVSYASGCIESTAGDAVYVQPGCTLSLLSGTIKAERRGVTVYADRGEDGTWFETRFQMDSGYVEAGDSAVTALGDGAGITIKSGVFLSKSAPVICGGEAEEQGGTNISIYRATLIAKGSAPGSLPCGVYHPQSGSLSLRGVEIHAEGGVGVLMRGGYLSVGDVSKQATRIYTGGSGQGSIGSGNPLSAGKPIVMDQKSGFYNNKSIRVRLSQTMQYRNELTPSAYPADGYGVRLVSDPPDSPSPDDTYSFGHFSTIRFDPLGGTGSAERVTDANGKIEWPGDPVREGYVFRGWSDSAHEPLKHIVDPETIIFDRNTTLYAAWIPEGTYVVSFRWDGLSRPDFDIKVTAGGGVLLDWPTHVPISFDGTVFMGWYADPDGGTEYPFDQPFTKDTILYAHWGAPVRPHTITFHHNDGTGAADTRTTGMDGVLADWPGGPTREGYIFWGWSRSGGYNIRPEQDFAFYEDTDLYARWIPVDGFAVTFHPNNGGDSEARNTNTSGTLDKWPDDPVLAGWTFGGWYADPKPPAGVYTEPSTVFQGHTHLYAYWIKNGGDDEPGNQTCTITFDANGGEGGTSLTTGTNGRLSALPAANPTRAGYTFSGWYTAVSGGSKVTTSTQFKKDTTVYAHWVKNSSPVDPTPDTPSDTKKTYTITFNANGGSVSPASAVTSADGRVTLPTPIRAGYTFAGWYTAPSGGTQVWASTVFSANATVYAQWSLPSDTPSVSYYQVYTPGTTYGGSLSVSHSYAAPGTLVTVTSSPWSGYELNRLSAIRADTGRELYLTGYYGSQYTFLMPDSDVQLIGSYAQTYTGTVNPGYPGTSTGGYPSYPGTAAGSGNSGYVDASASTKPVNWYYSGGHIYHVTDGLVPTGTALTRDMLISVLYNMDSSSSGRPAIWAAENDIVPDIYQSGLWGPDKSISREQAAMILFCYAQHKGYATNQTSRLTGYSDYSQMRSIARPAMSWSQAVGLITATSARTLSPQAILTCGEANAILARFVSGVAGGW